MAARTQQQYQVRFAWGVAGARRIAEDAHLLVWVDVLPDRADATDHATDHATHDAAAAPLAALPDGPEVVLGHLANATAVAGRVTSLQAERGDRCVVAVVAAGTGHGASDAVDGAGSPDFAVEDLLGAGAVVDALTAVGIDHTSPEAAAASAAYAGLRRAVKHLVSASEGARELDRATVHAALARDGELVTLRA